MLFQSNKSALSILLCIKFGICVVLRVSRPEKEGYDEMRLDTLPKMAEARKLYGRYGFEDIEAYYETPLKGTFFLGKKLRTA